jgi:hypothetical protein
MRTRNADASHSVVPCRVALLLPVGIFVFKNAEEGEGPPK